MECFKSRYQYEGKGFEADLVSYLSLTEFGSFKLTEVNTSTSPDDLTHIKETIANQKKLSEIGYDRVKENVKILRR